MRGGGPLRVDPRFTKTIYRPYLRAVDAMQAVAGSTETGDVWRDIAVIAAYVVAGLALGALTLRRQTD